MAKRVIALGLCVLAAAAVPAAAHEGLAARDAGAQRALLGGQPIALPAQRQAEPSLTATPRAECGPGSKPEPSIQGRVPAEEVESGRAADGYLCNLSRVAQSGSTGGFKVLRYVDANGRECAYYDTTLLFPTNVTSLSGEPTGVAVLDMSNPAQPVRTASLVTPAMQTPHESLNISVQRGLLAAVTGNLSFKPGVVDVYDISQDCRQPQLLASSPVGFLGHESGMAPDGRTFYSTSIATGHVTAISLDNPRAPVPLWVGQYDSHGMTISDDGTRGYLAAASGLIILDLSEIQARKPNPQVREISRLVWSNMTIPQVAHPVTIDGKPYLIEVDEFSQDESGGTVASNGPVVGAARIIDISDETKPRVVSNIRLEVHQPENREALRNDPGARFEAQGYAAHYCGVPQRREPGIVACSMIASGLRVFDIRDPENPREIAYHVAPPSSISASGSEYIDERANWAMSQPAFVPERGEIWYSDGTSGFYALKMAPGVWPFPAGSRGAGGGCTAADGLGGVSAAATGARVRLSFTRRANLPVRIDVFRVAKGRRVIGERLVARFENRTGAVTWRPPRGAGHYFVRFTMLSDGRRYDTRRIVLHRSANGRVVQGPDHHRRGRCGLLWMFKLERPVFGGADARPLRVAYRLTSRARVTVTVLRGERVVKRFRTAARAAGRTHRLTVPARGLPRGEYTVRLHAAGGEDQASARLGARRL